MFAYFNTNYYSIVEIGNGVLLKVVGKGIMAMKTSSSSRYVLKVLLVPEISQNLLYVGQLVNDNYTLLFKNRSCTIYSPTGECLIIVAMKKKWFLIDSNNICLTAFEDSSC